MRIDNIKDLIYWLTVKMVGVDEVAIGDTNSISKTIVSVQVDDIIKEMINRGILIVTEKVEISPDIGGFNFSKKVNRFVIIGLWKGFKDKHYKPTPINWS